MAPPVKTFLTEANLAGKTVIPFCTHGGGGEQQVIRDICALCVAADIKMAFSVYGAGDADVRCRIDRWIKEADS